MSERNVVKSPLSFVAVLLNLNGNAFFFLSLSWTPPVRLSRKRPLSYFFPHPPHVTRHSEMDAHEGV